MAGLKKLIKQIIVAHFIVWGCNRSFGEYTREATRELFSNWRGRSARRQCDSEESDEEKKSCVYGHTETDRIGTRYGKERR